MLLRVFEQLNNDSVAQTVGFSWAQLAGQSPALSGHLAATALGLGGVEGFGDRALACLEFGETEALSGIWQSRNKESALFSKISSKFINAPRLYLTASLTVAASFVVREHEARLARALEAARGVGAGPELAEAEIHTLIDILEVSIKERVHEQTA